MEPLVPQAKRGGRPEEYPKREIINGIRYLVRTGCAWRLLPREFPPWSTVYHYFRAWKTDGTWFTIHEYLRGEVRERVGRQRQPSAAVIDSQSVKTTEQGGLLLDTMRARRSRAASATSLLT
jgi:putative transposase